MNEQEEVFDDYAKTHSPLAGAFHEKMKSQKLYRFYHLPYQASVVSRYFSSRIACKKERDRCIETAYQTACGYFDPNAKQCISKEAADFYQKELDLVFTPTEENLELLCKKRNQSHVFTKIKELTGHSHENLKKAFDAELLNSDDYYAMYDYSYFLNQTEIEEHDNRFSERGLFRALETFMPDSIQYTIENTFAPINEMEKDLNDHAATFFNVAYQAYKDYVSNIETLLDAVGLGLSPMEENESIHDYLSRMLTSSI